MSNLPKFEDKNQYTIDDLRILCENCDPYSDPAGASRLLKSAASVFGQMLTQKAQMSKRDDTPYKEVVSLYNDICISLPRVQDSRPLSSSRKRHIKARFSAGTTIDDFKEAFRKAEKSPFLKGRNERGWKANFDWFIQNNNICKVIEGQYDGKPEESERKHSFNIDALVEFAKNNVPKIKD